MAGPADPDLGPAVGAPGSELRDYHPRERLDLSRQLHRNHDLHVGDFFAADHRDRPGRQWNRLRNPHRGGQQPGLDRVVVLQPSHRRIERGTIFVQVGTGTAKTITVTDGETLSQLASNIQSQVSGLTASVVTIRPARVCPSSATLPAPPPTSRSPRLPVPATARTCPLSASAVPIAAIPASASPKP